jgi:hypothetical protein
MNHAVEIDRGGVARNPRLTCWSHEGMPPTLTRQVHLDDVQWLTEASSFLKEHPTDRIIRNLDQAPEQEPSTPTVARCEHNSTVINGIKVQRFFTDDAARNRSGTRRGQAWT